MVHLCKIGTESTHKRYTLISAQKFTTLAAILVISEFFPSKVVITLVSKIP